MITVHMIGNAHLDPVWLWRKGDGVDAALATARSACDRLDEYPEFVFTCGTRWFHEQVERLDAELFERVRGFVEAGRWQLVGGMVVQPDCNLPAAASFRRHLQLGQAYYRERFGRATSVGYNVDSFGHTAYLPGLLRDAGIDCYVFLRPGPHEKALPARLFRWRSPGGGEVTAFRIAGAYTTRAAEAREHVDRSLTDLPEGVEHTLCFYGVGDHGGGPTKAQIEWVLAHADAIGGVRLVFSHPRAFFDAVAAGRDGLPVVEGELQHHAIGCYSVERPIKVALRRAEAALEQAAQALAALPDDAPADARAALDAAWGKLLFNQFHDILGGTCLATESRRAAAEMLDAASTAEQVVAAVTRRALRREAEPGTHKIVVLHPADEPFDGWVEHEPWLTCPADAPLALVDENDAAVEFQEVDPAAMVGMRRLLFRLAVGPRSRRVLRLTESGRPAAGQAGGDGLSFGDGEIGNGVQAVRSDGDAAIRLGGGRLRFAVYDDPTDTWTHCHDRPNRFEGEHLGDVRWAGKGEVVERGPLRAALRLQGRFGDSRLWCRAMIRRDEPAVHLRVRVVWGEVRRRLVLTVEPPSRIVERTDLVSGGPLRRPLDGLEYPLGGGMLLATECGPAGIVAPEVFSASVDERCARLTLLRSPYAAHHDPFPAGARPDQPATDQGTHEFELVIRPGCDGGIGAVERLARQMQMPPIVWDLTG